MTWATPSAASNENGESHKDLICKATKGIMLKWGHTNHIYNVI